MDQPSISRGGALSQVVAHFSSADCAARDVSSVLVLFSLWRLLSA
jgi:hypothetical protein